MTAFILCVCVVHVFLLKYTKNICDTNFWDTRYIRSFMASLKVSWHKSLYWIPKDVRWAIIEQVTLPPQENLVCFGSVKFRIEAKNVKNMFWEEVIRGLSSFCTAYKPDNDEILADFIRFSASI